MTYQDSDESHLGHEESSESHEGIICAKEGHEGDESCAKEGHEGDESCAKDGREADEVQECESEAGFSKWQKRMGGLAIQIAL